MAFKDYVQKVKKQRAEQAGYRRIVDDKVKLAGRQAYADEAVIQARARAKRMAKEKFNRPTFAQKARKFAETQSKNISKVAVSKPMKSVSPKPMKTSGKKGKKKKGKKTRTSTVTSTPTVRKDAIAPSMNWNF